MTAMASVTAVSAATTATPTTAPTTTPASGPTTATSTVAVAPAAGLLRQLGSVEVWLLTFFKLGSALNGEGSPHGQGIGFNLCGGIAHRRMSGATHLGPLFSQNGFAR